MERQKRVYPAKRNHMQLLNTVLLILTAVVIGTGFIDRDRASGFTLEMFPSETAVPLNESFDETQTSADVVLPAASWYAIQVGVFENQELAQESSEVFRKRGAAGYIWQDGRYRVLAAAYPTREDAQTVREQLSEQHSIDSYLYAVEMPEISLRISGMKGQLEILQAAFSHVHDLVLQVQGLSVAMDRQEVSVDEALGQLEGLKAQMSVVLLRIQQRFVPPVHETVRALMECFEAHISFFDELSNDMSMIELGMKLKYQTLDLLNRIQNVYHTLH